MKKNEKEINALSKQWSRVYYMCFIVHATHVIEPSKNYVVFIKNRCFFLSYNNDFAIIIAHWTLSRVKSESVQLDILN